jgi:hypothetical protein
MLQQTLGYQAALDGVGPLLGGEALVAEQGVLLQVALELAV